MRYDSQHGMTSLTRLLAVGATLLLSALPAEPASFAYARSGPIVYVIDTANPSIVARIPTGSSGFSGPGSSRFSGLGRLGGLAVDPSETHLYTVANNNTVAVVDTASRTVIGGIPVSAPNLVLMHPSRRIAYASGATVTVIDTATNTVIATIPMGPGFFVRSMVLHPAGTKLYVSNSIGGPGGKVIVIDTSTNTVATTIPVVGAGALAAHPAGTFVYIINANGVSVLDTATDTVVATIPASQLPPGLKAMVVHPHGTFLYVLASINFAEAFLVSTPSGNVAVVDTQTNQVVTTIALSVAPVDAALSPSGTRLYVVGDRLLQSCGRPPCIPPPLAAGTAVIDTTTNAVLTTVPPGAIPASASSVTVDPSGHSVYANAGGLTVIDASTNAVTATLPLADVVFSATVPASPGDQVFYTIRSLDGGRRGTPWGAPGDRPVPADYDGDGRADVAIFRPREAGQEGVWWIQQSSDGSISRQQWGAVSLGDVPVPADYDGDGRADVAVWRPSTGEWFVMRSRTGAVTSVAFGAPGDVPVPRDYDGDGKTDVAMWRPSTGEWFILRASDGRVVAQQWGARGDLPMPADCDGDRAADLTVYRP